MIKKFALIAVAAALHGCSDSDISEVKESKLNYSGLTVGEYAEEIKQCEEINWYSFERDNGKVQVAFTCNFQIPEQNRINETIKPEELSAPHAASERRSFERFIELSSVDLRAMQSNVESREDVHKSHLKNLERQVQFIEEDIAELEERTKMERLRNHSPSHAEFLENQYKNSMAYFNQKLDRAKQSVENAIKAKEANADKEAAELAEFREMEANHNYLIDTLEKSGPVFDRYRKAVEDRYAENNKKTYVTLVVLFEVKPTGVNVVSAGYKVGKDYLTKGEVEKFKSKTDLLTILFRTNLTSKSRNAFDFSINDIKRRTKTDRPTVKEPITCEETGKYYFNNKSYQDYKCQYNY